MGSMEGGQKATVVALEALLGTNPAEWAALMTSKSAAQLTEEFIADWLWEYRRAVRAETSMREGILNQQAWARLRAAVDRETEG